MTPHQAKYLAYEQGWTLHEYKEALESSKKLMDALKLHTPTPAAYAAWLARGRICAAGCCTIAMVPWLHLAGISREGAKKRA